MSDSKATPRSDSNSFREQFSARSESKSSRDQLSARPDNSLTNREVITSSRDNLSARSNSSNIPATDRSGVIDSSRSTMSTSRVHTALAALTAEKESLKNKLLFIDAQLENNSKKKVGTFKK